MAAGDCPGPAQQALPCTRRPCRHSGRDSCPLNPACARRHLRFSRVCVNTDVAGCSPPGDRAGATACPCPSRGAGPGAQSRLPPLPSHLAAGMLPSGQQPLSRSLLGTALLLNLEAPVPGPGPSGWSRAAVTSQRPQKLRARPFFLVAPQLAFWGDRGGLGSFLPSKEMKTRPLGGARWAADPSLRPLRVARPPSCLAPAWGPSPGGLSASTGSCPATRSPH